MKKIYLISLLALTIVVFSSINLVFANTVIINPHGNVITLQPLDFAATDIIPESVEVTYSVLGGDPDEVTLTPLKVALNSQQAMIVLSANELPPYANTTVISGTAIGYGDFEIQYAGGFAWARR